eukprot:CAMPEP_0194061590 /NCGR_PEP_ID=MMETSP0009_2-20130614/75105_1 /TAXON_ID=210454 /ORGANISM="Grammatophora oceanica, Strain CCMP 410" /LENGTH=98 /DNA_ID=CAMNT_0038712981 /DNA_START=75 /DNA_END=367 /DNA_ORIENTATION=-
MMADGSYERHSTPASSPRLNLSSTRSYREYIMVGLGCLALFGFGYGMGSSYSSDVVSTSSSYSVASKRPARPSLMEASSGVHPPTFQQQSEASSATSS